MARVGSAEDRRDASSFIGSFPDGPDHVVIVLRGELEAAVLLRLDVHLTGALAAGTRFVIIDASAVTRCDPGLLDLLGRTQLRLARRHGLLTMRGLHPRLLAGVGAAAESVRGPSVGDPVVPDGESSGAWSAVGRAR